MTPDEKDTVVKFCPECGAIHDENNVSEGHPFCPNCNYGVVSPGQMIEGLFTEEEAEILKGCA